VIRIAPSILSADYTKLAEEIRSVEEGGADLLHLDVMDGHFVPNLTFGPILVEAVNRLTDLPLDVHLMMLKPERYLKQFREAGADYLTVHVEVCGHEPDVFRQIRALGAKAGVAINPETPGEALDPVVALVDMVLFMTVHPGFGGQEFIPDVLLKMKKFTERYRPRSIGDLLIEVDGGIQRHTAYHAVQAGADILVAGSAIFKAEDRADEITALRTFGEVGSLPTGECWDEG
jgi:ribulose-phosphate 3-epimerase